MAGKNLAIKVGKGDAHSMPAYKFNTGLKPHKVNKQSKGQSAY